MFSEKSRIIIPLMCACLIACAAFSGGTAGASEKKKTQGAAREAMPQKGSFPEIDSMIEEWKFSEAFAAITEMLNSGRALGDVQKSELLNKLGIILKMLNKNDDAMSKFSEAYKISNTSEVSLYYLALMNVSSGNFKTAEKFADRLAEKYPDSPWSHFMLATIHAVSSEGRKAFLEAQKALKLDENLFEANIFLINYYKKEKKYSEARDIMKTLLKLKPNFERAPFFSTASFENNVNKARAVNLVKSETLCAYGLLMYNYLKNPNTALKYYNESLKLNPSYLLAKAAKAQCLALFKKKAEALALLKEAVESGRASESIRGFYDKLKAGQDIDYYLNIDMETMNKTSVTKYFRFCENCGKQNKSTRGRCIFCGKSITKKSAEPVSAAEESPEPAPEETDETLLESSAQDRYLEISLMHIENKEFESAEVQLKKLLEISPDLPEVYNMLGITCLGCGRYDDAMANFKKAVGLNSNFAEGYFSLGKTYELQGKPKNAGAMYEKALKIDSEYEEVKEALNKLKSSQAQQKK